MLNSEMGMIKFKIPQILSMDRDYAVNLDVGESCWNYGLETLSVSFAVYQMISKLSGVKTIIKI